MVGEHTEPGGLPGVSRRAPTVTVALPVYNGDDYLEEALDGLLAQTYTDFELVISDNASTDRTAEICRAYAARDPRIRYVRQPVNIGAVPNHNVLLDLARGRYFKWVGHDDLYAPELLERCVRTLEAHPTAVLANVWDGVVDEVGRKQTTPYTLESAHPSPHVRFRSLLREPGGNDFYGMFRTEMLREMPPLGSYLHSDRTYMAALSLSGPFVQVPEVLYFRRDHPQRASRAARARDVVVKLDPTRAGRLRNPVVRLYAEYVTGLFSAVFRAPLSSTERLRCLWELFLFLATRLRPSVARQIVTGSAPPAEVPVTDPTEQ